MRTLTHTGLSFVIVCVRIAAVVDVHIKVRQVDLLAARAEVTVGQAGACIVDDLTVEVVAVAAVVALADAIMIAVVAIFARVRIAAVVDIRLKVGQVDLLAARTEVAPREARTCVAKDLTVEVVAMAAIVAFAYAIIVTTVVVTVVVITVGRAIFVSIGRSVFTDILFVVAIEASLGVAAETARVVAGITALTWVVGIRAVCPAHVSTIISVLAEVVTVVAIAVGRVFADILFVVAIEASLGVAAETARVVAGITALTWVVGIRAVCPIDGITVIIVFAEECVAIAFVGVIIGRKNDSTERKHDEAHHCSSKDLVWVCGMTIYSKIRSELARKVT
jgi:hypothetical protein